jgi:serine/threonine-protein kinase
MAHVSDTLIDTIFDGRYRIVRRLGAGGMANVYLAEDDELGRRVAIKILNGRYANDELFVERFRREAKSAAGLSHPNIVSIYDRGEAEGTYYIAMEVIEGRSLKELIRTSGRLRPAQAISYTRQMLAALRFAHANGIIHRDIKPHNILVGPEERLKVTDFGIARAGTSQMTEAGSIMGTAQYLSPEQARGSQVTAASDLYSVGIVLYEMLTGQVPFTGDTHVEIAMKHLNEPPRPPSAVAPGIPADLDRVVLRALAKNPAERYQTADEMDSDLARIEAGLPVARETADAATAVLTGVARAAPTAATQVLRPRRQTPAVPPPPRRPPAYDEYPEPPRRRRSVLPWLIALVLLVAAGVAGWYVYQRVSDELADRKPVPVPNVEGLKRARAIALIEKANLKAKVEEASSDTVPAGTVIEQNPGAGQRIAKGETVTITVSTGVEQVEVPKVTGRSEVDAVGALEGAGFDVKRRYVFSDKADAGIVLTQDPKAGALVDKGSVVTLKVSKGIETFEIPDVVNQGQDDAVALLQEQGFEVSVVTVASDQPEGLVLSQNPSAGTSAPKGTTVEIQVSEGPQTVTVPGVVGMDEGTAASTLQDQGFSVNTTDETVFSPDNDGVVLDQDPPAGSQVDPGSTITIVVGRFVLNG